MARTALTANLLKGPFPSSVNAGDLDLTWTVADPTNKNAVPASGRDIILFWNTDTVSHNINISSAPDSRNRKGDIGPYSLGASKIGHFQVTDTVGWVQSDGNLYFDADSALVKYAVLKLNF
jgi:hypothetical protein